MSEFMGDHYIGSTLMHILEYPKSFRVSLNISTRETTILACFTTSVITLGSLRTRKSHILVVADLSSQQSITLAWAVTY